MATLALIAAIGFVLTVFWLLPKQIAEGEVFGVYFPFRALDLERKSRFFRRLLAGLFGGYLYSTYGFFSQEFGVVFAGTVLGMVVVTGIAYRSQGGAGRGDETTGADPRDLIGSDE